MNAWLIVICVLLVVLTLAITINVEFEFDVLNNFGTIKVKIFKFITIVKSNFSIIDDYLNFSPNDSKKLIKIRLDVNDVSVRFFNELISYVKHKILIEKFNSELFLCLENAFAISMLSGLINIIFGILSVKIKNNNKDILMQNKLSTGFRHNLIKVKFSVQVVLTIFDLLWSIIRTVLIVRKEEDSFYEKKSGKQENNN